MEVCENHEQNDLFARHVPKMPHSQVLLDKNNNTYRIPPSQRVDSRQMPPARYVQKQYSRSIAQSQIPLLPVYLDDGDPT
jgi:hypothetical protein